MKKLLLFILMMPVLGISQEKDSVIVYQGRGAFESKIIDLSHRNLDEIPAKAFSFEVEVLILDHNNLTEIPNWIGNLTNLKTLSIRNNNLKSINHVLQFNKQLEVLILSGNPNLRSLPSLSGCKALRVLDVTDTQINELPSFIRGMENMGYFKYSKRNTNSRTVSDLKPHLKFDCIECLTEPRSGLHKDRRVGYYFDPKKRKCVRTFYSTGPGCVPAPFLTLEKCKSCCEKR